MFGLLGEGVLPPDGLERSITSVKQALQGTLAPTAVLARSRSSGDAETPPRWLPDTFIAQVWCNRAMMTGWGLEDERFHDSTLLELLPKFVRAHRTNVYGAELVVADGTSFLTSTFDLDGDNDTQNSMFLGNVAAADGGSLYIGTIDHALVRGQNGDENAGVVSIGTALWPPPYVLETAALENGLVIVNNVNCGYLDFAVNFLLAARKVVSDIKVRRKRRSHGYVDVSFLKPQRMFPFSPLAMSFPSTNPLSYLIRTIPWMEGEQPLLRALVILAYGRLS